jgi:TRAP-type C4-dicarboxylate transport system substrate-binding protein
MTKLIRKAPLAIAAAALLAAAGAQAENIKIKVADSFPVGHYLSRYISLPLIEQLKASPATKGYDFEYYPSQQLGKSKDMLSLTQAGVVDIAYVAPGFVSDKMPLSAVAELPLKFTGSCKPTLAYWNLAKPGGALDKAEFAPNGVRLLFTVVLPPYQLFARKPFADLKDLEGMKIRTSGFAKELLLRKIKAVPVLMPTPEVYESMSRGTIDGSLFPFSSLPPYGIDKLSKAGTIGENFGTFVANFVISEKRFQSLPPAFQQQLSEMGEQFAKRVCLQVEEDEGRDIEKVKAAGATLTPLPAADSATLAKVSLEVAKDWADTLDKRGKPGTEILDAFSAGLK